MKRLAYALAFLLSLPAAASADSFTASFAGTGLGAGVAGVKAGAAFNVWAGEIKWASSSWLDDFASYCVDLDNALTSTQTFSTSNPSQISSSEGAKISYLIAQNFSSVTTGWMAAGLQLAIWNVLYDTDYLASAGSFRSFTGEAVKFADAFLQDLKIHQTSLATNVVFLDTARGQDQVTKVPEPATMVVFGIGAFAFVAGLRRMRRT